MGANAISNPFETEADLKDTRNESDVRASTTALIALLNTFLQTAHDCADASITVGAEVNDVRPITIQLKKADGSDCDAVKHCLIVVFTSAAMTAFATTGGSTGLAAGTDGALLALVAKKVFIATSEADGDIDLTWTDTQTETVAVAVILPNGKVVVSSAFANAGA